MVPKAKASKLEVEPVETDLDDLDDVAVEEADIWYPIKLARGLELLRTSFTWDSVRGHGDAIRGAYFTLWDHLERKHGLSRDTFDPNELIPEADAAPKEGDLFVCRRERYAELVRQANSHGFICRTTEDAHDAWKRDYVTGWFHAI